MRGSIKSRLVGVVWGRGGTEVVIVDERGTAGDVLSLSLSVVLSECLHLSCHLFSLLSLDPSLPSSSS